MDDVLNGARRDVLYNPLQARYGPNTVLVERLFSRLRMLSARGLDGAVVRWRELVGPHWFAAESALTQALAATGRHSERYRALQRLHELVWRRHWLDDPPSPEARTPDAGLQYVVTTAVLALVVRDHLADDCFALLYAPAAAVIPLRELAYDVRQPLTLEKRAILADAPPPQASDVAPPGGQGRRATVAEW